MNTADRQVFVYHICLCAKAKMVGSDCHKKGMKMSRNHGRRYAPGLKSGALKSVTVLGALAACTLLAQTALADAKAGVDAWSRAEAANNAGDKATAHREYLAAIHEWQAQADKGDPDSQFNLAQAYKWGKGVPQDLTRAEVLFAKAAAKGHTQAADNYGLLLFQRGQHAQAMPYLQAAADRGEKGALYLMGIAHFNGENVPKDWIRAYALETIANQSVDGQPALPQARAALAQMDQFISLEDRQRGASLATEMSAKIDANRQRQLASNDLGNTVTPSGADAAPPVAAPSPPPVKAPPPPKVKPTPAPSDTPSPAAAHTPPPRPSMLTQAGARGNETCRAQACSSQARARQAGAGRRELEDPARRFRRARQCRCAMGQGQQTARRRRASAHERAHRQGDSPDGRGLLGRQRQGRLPQAAGCRDYLYSGAELKA
jgi:hypothetical protein